MVAEQSVAVKCSTVKWQNMAVRCCIQIKVHRFLYGQWNTQEMKVQENTGMIIHRPIIKMVLALCTTDKMHHLTTATWKVMQWKM